VLAFFFCICLFRLSLHVQYQLCSFVYVAQAIHSSVWQMINP
jgi:hypothetical protein